MPEEIDREGVRRMVDGGAQVLEVLPAEEYVEDHLPGAISIPLKRIESEALSTLDVNRPVIAYCWDVA
jgi:rhodanese-related sulfurtransferase